MSSNAYEIRERRVEEAIEALNDGLWPSVRGCASHFGIPRSTLQNRWNGKASKSTREAANKRLSTAQERAIKDYIIRMDEKNLSLTLKLVEDAANYVLREAHSNAAPVGVSWAKRFLDRNPDLKRRRQRPIAVHRKNADWIPALEQYFKQLKSVMDQYGIQPPDTWNMDETGFRIGCGRSRVVITLATKKPPPRMADPDNREYITSVEAINAAGDTISPFLIFKGSTIAHRLTVNDLHWATTLATSETAYSNDDLAMDWLHHFIRNVKRKRVGQWILLICDGFGSHATFPFLKLATANKVLLFRLPPHSTHITQPLDVGVFQAYKQHHGNAVDKAVRQGNVKFNRLDFLEAFQRFRNATFKPKTVENAWKLTGIAPFDPSVIIDPLKERRDREAQLSDTPSASEADDCLQRTPRGPSSHRQHIKALRDQFRHDLNTGAPVLRFLKASEKQTTALELHTRDLDDCQRASAKRNNRERFSNTVACSSGVITVRDCRKLHSTRLAKELKKAEGKAKREAAKAAKDPSNQRLASAAKDAAAKLKSMSDEVAARVAADEIELAQLEKEDEALSEPEAEEEQQELTSDEDLPDLNTMKYSYLNMARPANVSEANYISPFRPGADLERRFQYNPDLLPPPLPTRRREISLPPIVYGHDYTEAEARDMLWRMNHPWVDEVDLTGV